jgi:hypothetical protein
LVVALMAMAALMAALMTLIGENDGQTMVRRWSDCVVIPNL